MEQTIPEGFRVYFIVTPEFYMCRYILFTLKHLGYDEITVFYQNANQEIMDHVREMGKEYQIEINEDHQVDVSMMEESLLAITYGNQMKTYSISNDNYNQTIKNIIKDYNSEQNRIYVEQRNENYPLLKNKDLNSCNIKKSPKLQKIQKQYQKFKRK